MNVLVGRGMGGPAFTARDVAASGARLGEPTWGPAGLLRDLELRLGIPPIAVEASTRVPLWVTRIKAAADPTAFYKASFAVDAIGTAETLLAWRDALVEAGWEGGPIPDGGDRLAALTALEAPPGTVDRLVRIERELDACEYRLYERIDLVEPRASWSFRWQAIFRRLEGRGTVIIETAPPIATAADETELGLLQRLIRDNAIVDPSKHLLRGDGSLLVFRAETATELGEFVAAFVAKSSPDVVVVRAGDVSCLEAGLARQGLPTQGHRAGSTWRPANQILALALELAFEPRDPYRVLELLTLSVGPFRGRLGATLARAVARQPGIGGAEWLRRKAELATRLREEEATRQREAGKTETEADALAEKYVRERMQRVADWIEAPCAGADGIARSRLLEIATRVRTWLQPRAAPDSDASEIYAPAYRQATAFAEALMHLPVDTLTREETQHLFDTVARDSEVHELSTERAGRLAHVDHPSAVLGSAGTVVFWNFVAGSERRPKLPPWSDAERRAMTAAGLVLPDMSTLLGIEANAWRRAILAARERVVFVVPRCLLGSATASHPIWDEVTARLGLDEAPALLASLTREVSGALHPDSKEVDVATLAPLRLPEPRGFWELPADLLAQQDDRPVSATALQTLLGCPLAWVLEHRAALRFGAVAKVASGRLLNGNLSHRLVEELFHANAFDLPEAKFLARAESALDGLVRTEGAILLLEGAVFEYTQLAIQIRRAMRELHRYLKQSRYRIAAVEAPVAMKSSVGNPHGRLDVRLVDDAGKEAILDLKWGKSTYLKLLEAGRAIQLALYALASRRENHSIPPAGYFAVGSAKVLTCDKRMRAPRTLSGLSSLETWERVERTAAAVQASFARGIVPVANTRKALPLLEQLRVPEPERASFYDAEPEAACAYCAFPTLCGRAWEGVQ